MWGGGMSIDQKMKLSRTLPPPRGDAEPVGVGAPGSAPACANSSRLDETSPMCHSRGGAAHPQRQTHHTQHPNAREIANRRSNVLESYQSSRFWSLISASCAISCCESLPIAAAVAPPARRLLAANMPTSSLDDTQPEGQTTWTKVVGLSFRPPKPLSPTHMYV